MRIVQIVIKAPNLAQKGFTRVYSSILEGEQPCSCNVDDSFRAFSPPPYSFSNNSSNYLKKYMFHHKCPQNRLLMLFNSIFIQNRGGYIVRGGLTPSFSTHYYKKYSKNIIKAPDLAQSCTMV